MGRARSRAIAGLGDGFRARKAVDLALRHKKDSFVAVERLKPEEMQHFQYLKKRGQKLKPANLEIKAGARAGRFLSAQKANSFDHVYAHFLLQHVSCAERAQIFRELMRTLKPGARFVTVEEVHYEKTLSLEMQRAGFRVTARRVSPFELSRLGTDNADRNAASALHRGKIIEDLRQLTSAEFARISAEIETRPKSPDDFKRIDIEEVRDFVRAKWKDIEGKDMGPEAAQALKLVLRDMRHRYDAKPFVVITAAKGRVRAQ